ncbi:hypothetical protein [Streptomyces sp. Root369]|uniref:hypothetical protein n=1 Tax=Streptomyces sp. Root369 TaxID=1736523 RepID=UPI00070ECB16|nr:hypothetical protein [Streptomyces sp. Root369]KQW03350.1 hypothetical protein ASD08_44445 [Streptomyces sp. Root369]
MLRRLQRGQWAGGVVDTEEQDVVFDGLGGAVGDLLDVQAQPYAAGAFTVGRKAALQFVVETVQGGLGRGVVSRVSRARSWRVVLSRSW